MLLLPLSSRVFSAVGEAAGRVPAPTLIFPTLCGRWVTGRSRANSFLLLMWMGQELGRLILCIELVIKLKINMDVEQCFFQDVHTPSAGHLQKERAAPKMI